MNSLKLKYRRGEIFADCCDVISADAERLEIAGAFNTKHLGYIICIFKDTSDSRFRLWATQKYKVVIEFIKKLCVCDKEFMQTDDLITYGYLVQ